MLIAECERYLLGGLLLSPEIAADVLPSLRMRPEDFSELHAPIFAAMQRVVLGNDAPLTAESLLAELKQVSIDDACEMLMEYDRDAITELVDGLDASTPVPPSWAALYGEAVRSEATQRKLTAWASR